MRYRPRHASAEPGSLSQPRVLVLSSLFPGEKRPHAGLFIRERVFRVGRTLPLVVMAPQAWFPGQSVLRLFRRHFRIMEAPLEIQDGFEVHRPRFLCVPGVLKRLDGLMMAISVRRLAARLVKEKRLNIIDAHFAFPDGYAAVLLGRWLGLPVMITLRGKEEQQMSTAVRHGVSAAVQRADGLVCVSRRLAQVATDAGADPSKAVVIGNGVDIERFHAIPRGEARRALGIPLAAKVLITVGSLVEGKGLHHVIDCMPTLRERFSNLHYLVVGGAGHGRDLSGQLRNQAKALGVDDVTHFLGPYEPDQLKVPLSAADVFVLATSYEGWANVFLEAMACGLPVVTTRVGGNADVVSSRELGYLVQAGNGPELLEAICQALVRDWDRDHIVGYAKQNAWDNKVLAVVEQLRGLALG